MAYRSKFDVLPMPSYSVSWLVVSMCGAVAYLEQIVSIVVTEIGDVLEEKSELEGKEKLEIVCNTGFRLKVKRHYVKKNMEYWNNMKVTGLDRKKKVAI